MSSKGVFAYTTAAQMRAQMEELWTAWDRLLDAVPASGWTRKYGPDWTYQDVPYHVAYFDRVMVADVIEAGASLPEVERFNLGSIGEVNRWNEREFAKRAAGQTPQQSITELLRQRERIRALIAHLSDEDLEAPAFNHFFGLGFRTVGEAIAGARQHAWSEGWELATRLGRRDIMFSESVIHSGLASYLGFMGAMLDRNAAATTGNFTMVMDLAGRGGGSWTIRVGRGAASVTEGGVLQPDLAMKMSPDTYMTMFKKIRNPFLLMLTGKIRVKGLTRMGTFGKLFPEPAPDKQMAAPPEAAA